MSYRETLTPEAGSDASSSFSTPPPTPPRSQGGGGGGGGVVIQAGMSFALDDRKHPHPQRSASLHQRPPTGIRQHFRAEAAHTADGTGSSALSNAIREFLGRTDHVMNEWNQIRGVPKRSLNLMSIQLKLIQVRLIRINFDINSILNNFSNFIQNSIPVDSIPADSIPADSIPADSN